MPDRLDDVALLLVPGRGHRVELLHETGLLVEEPPAQDVGEEVVVAVPVPPVVQRDHEQVVPLEGLEHAAAIGLTGEGVAQGAVHPVEDGRPQQEVLDVGRQALQDLLDEVVDDVPVVPGEAGDEAGHVLAPGHRQGGELQRGDPPLGPPLECLHVGRRRGRVP